jgi:hypothetical protein
MLIAIVEHPGGQGVRHGSRRSIPDRFIHLSDPGSVPRLYPTVEVTNPPDDVPYVSFALSL